jgi:hypothetical protein
LLTAFRKTVFLEHDQLKLQISNLSENENKRKSAEIGKCVPSEEIYGKLLMQGFKDHENMKHAGEDSRSACARFEMRRV